MRAVRLLSALVVLLMVAACGLGTGGTPTADAHASFDVTGHWQRCHQLGACKYTLELAAPGGVATVEVQRLNATGDEGGLVPDVGLPAKLTNGLHKVTVVSTMYGDTIEPNGDPTVIGEEARCTAEFVVGQGTSRVVAMVDLIPNQCTITFRDEELLY